MDFNAKFAVYGNKTGIEAAQTITYPIKKTDTPNNILIEDLLVWLYRDSVQYFKYKVNIIKPEDNQFN